MAKQEKEALLALASSVVFALLALPLRGLPRALQCEAVLIALLAFIALLWVGRRLVGLNAKALDERDLAIRYRAGLIASHVFGAVVMVGAALLCALSRTSQVVPTFHVMLLAYCGWLAMSLAWSVTVLSLYRRGT